MALSTGSQQQPDSAPMGTLNPTWYQWALFAGVGAVMFALLPDRAKWPFFWLVLLGGLVWLDRSGAGGLKGFITTFQTGGAK